MPSAVLPAAAVVEAPVARQLEAVRRVAAAVPVEVREAAARA